MQYNFIFVKTDVILFICCYVYYNNCKTCIYIFFHNSKLHFYVFMMYETKDTFTSSFCAQFRIVHVLDVWGMFAQACAVMPHPLCRGISCVGAYLDTSVAYHKYYRKL